MGRRVLPEAPIEIERVGLVARRLQIVYVPTPKVACTSVMWALARAEGTAAPPSTISSGRGQSRDTTIHDPLIHGLPTIAELDGDTRRSALEDPSWLRFCITRDPYARFLSGWVNRVLLNPAGVLRADLAFSAEALEEVAPTDLGEAFRTFAHGLLGSGAPALSDPHFVSQVSRVRPDDFPYTDVVPLSDLRTFVERVAASSAERGGFDPQIANASLRIEPNEVYDAATAALVDSHFADDFDRFGCDRKLFAATAPPLPLTERETALVRIVRERSNRLVDLQQLHVPWRPMRHLLRRIKDSLSRHVRRDRRSGPAEEGRFRRR